MVFVGLMSCGWPGGKQLLLLHKTVLGIFIAIHHACRRVCLQGEGSFFTTQIEGQVKIKTRVRTVQEVGSDHRY